MYLGAIEERVHFDVGRIHGWQVGLCEGESIGAWGREA
jgi:hypothetical protein